MKYLVTAQEMKQYDKNTIEYLGIPGPVLMERAALAAEDFIKERFDAVKERTKVLIFAGMGNNGGDGLALARLLAADGYAVAVKCVGDMQRATKQWKSQWQTLQHFPVKTDSNIAVDEYNVIVDALFGVGLSRPVEGNYADAVKEMNKAEGFKLALDVPSGICSDTGRVLGCAFLADATVTFGFCKRGLVLYPGAEYAGEVRTANVGIGQESFLGQEPEMYTYEKGSVQLIKRNAAGNKGTFGKALLVAGSNGMAGAAILAAKAAYRTGSRYGKSHHCRREPTDHTAGDSGSVVRLLQTADGELRLGGCHRHRSRHRQRRTGTAMSEDRGGEKQEAAGAGCRCPKPPGRGERQDAGRRTARPGCGRQSDPSDTSCGGNVKTAKTDDLRVQGRPPHMCENTGRTISCRSSCQGCEDCGM